MARGQKIEDRRQNSEERPKSSVRLLHDVSELRLRPGVRVVVSGHSHKPTIEERDGVLYVNPGSAGPRRFTLPIALGELRIAGASVRARIKEPG